VSGGKSNVPTYRVLSGPGNVVYVFSAGDDEEAERFARRLSTDSCPVRPRAGTPHFVSVEALVEEDWKRVCAWVPGG
jgi:hypothetical protein